MGINIERGGCMAGLTKTNFFKVILVIAILFSGIICVCRICNYKSSSVAAGSQSEQAGSFSENRGSISDKSSFNKQNQNNLRFGNQTSQNQGMQRGGSSGTDSNCSYFLVGYFVIFIGLFIAAYYYFTHGKLKIAPGYEKILILAILLVGLFLRLACGTLTEGFSSDVNLFRNWAASAAHSLATFYTSSGSADYPPFYIYILAVIGKIAGTTAMSSYYTLLLKVPSILADVLSGYLIYRLAKKYTSSEISILLSAFYVFNPAVLINSVFWGQVDSFFTLLIILAVYMLSEKKICFSAMFFTAAVLMKPQGIIFLPVLFFELVRERSLKSFVKAALSVIVTALVIILPFSQSQSPLWIVKLYTSTVSEYPYASVNAYNFFNLIGANYKKDSATLLLFSYHTWGMIFIVLITLFTWFIYIKGKDRSYAFAAALIQIAGVFTFSVGMHERYLFPAAALAVLAFIYLKDKRLLYIALGFTITIFSNTAAVLYGSFSNDVAVFTSILNVFLFGYLVKIMWDAAVKNKKFELIKS